MEAIAHKSPTIAHICESHFCALNGMREFYGVLKVYPTSEHGDTMLIRSHIAYHSGNAVAERAMIRPSRGHSYRVNLYGHPDKSTDRIVRIIDYYDHRDGVTGYR